MTAALRKFLLLKIILYLWGHVDVVSSSEYLRYGHGSLQGLDDVTVRDITKVWRRKRVMARKPSPFDEICRQYAVKPPPHLDYRQGKYGDILHHIREKSIGDWTQNQTFRDMLSSLSIDEADRIAYDTFNSPFYNATTATRVLRNEVETVLRAAPIPDLAALNGVNIGAGGRAIPGTIPLDAHRSVETFNQLPLQQQNVPNTFLSWADKLPFAHESLDFIVSLHNFEHLADPAGAMNHYLDVLKPGGGIGVVIPNYDYCWDASRDASVWGHRWSTKPEVVCKLYHEFWRDRADLVDIVVFEEKLSFGFILRKKGEFVPFDSKGVPSYGTGDELMKAGKYVH